MPLTLKDMSKEECYITQDVARDPVVTECGHYYDGTALNSWHARRSDEFCTCPVCNHPLKSHQFKPYNQETVNEFFQRADDKGNVKKAFLFIEYGAKLTETQSLKYLKLAQEEKRTDICLLLSSHCDFQQLMIAAVARDDLPAVTSLVDSGVNEGYEPTDVLHRALKRKDTVLALSMLEQGADVNQNIQTANGPQNLLQYAVNQNLPEFRDILLSGMHGLLIDKLEAVLVDRDLWTIKNTPLIKVLLGCDLAGGLDLDKLMVPRHFDRPKKLLDLVIDSNWSSLEDFLVKEKKLLTPEKNTQELLTVFNQRYRKKVDTEWFSFFRKRAFSDSRANSAEYLFQHAAGKHAGWFFGNKGHRSREVLQDLGLMTATGKATEATPFAMKRHCRG